MVKYMQINRFGMIIIAVLALLAIRTVAHVQIFHFKPDRMVIVSWNGTLSF